MRSLKLLGALLLVVLGLTSESAYANTVRAAIDCGVVTLTFDKFLAGNNTVSTRVLSDGVEVTSHVSNFTGPANTDTFSFPIQGGTHTIKTMSTWTDVERGVPRGYNLTKVLSGCVPPCVPGTPNPALAKASGDSFGLSAKLPLLPAIAAQPKVTSSQSGGTGVNHADNGITLPAVPGVLSGVLLGVTSTSTIDPTRATGFSTAETGALNLLNGMIKADVVRTGVEAIADGTSSAVSDASTTITGLVINGMSIANVAPNTVVNIPGGKVILRETIKSTSAPASGQLSGGTYTSDITVNAIHVILNGLTPALNTEIIVSHATAHAEFPQTKVCSAINPHLVGGSAAATVINLLDNLLTQKTTSVELPISGGGPFVANGAGATLPGGLGNAGTVTSSTQGSAAGPTVTASSFDTVANVSLAGGQVTATLIKTQSNSTATSTTATSDATGTTFTDLMVLGTPIAGNPAPNTTITLPGLGYVILNEQFADGPAGGTGLTVRAIHLHLNGAPPLLPGTDIIVSESRSSAKF